jgi:hypothetical protein
LDKSVIILIISSYNKQQSIDFMTERNASAAPATISELLKLSGSQYRLFDIGRLVSKLPKQEF